MERGGGGAAPGSESGFQGATPPAKSLGSPSDALTGLLQAASQEVKQAELGQPDVRVLTAFALGWQVAEIYRPDRGSDSAIPASGDDLPGLSRLTDEEWTQIGLDQVQAGITKLTEPIVAAGLWAPDAQEFARRLSESADPAVRTSAVREFHVDLLSILTAADFRLGKAYGLGRALADTTRPPVDYRAELAPARVATVSEWIRDLATAFPPHAAHPMAASLDAWSRWAYTDQPRQNVDVTVGKLEAQGRLWRSLLSGEKRPVDMLETSDYVRAGEGMLQRSGALAGHFVKHLWWLVLLIIALFAVGILVLALSSSPTAIVAGAGAVLGSLGLSWKGIGASLGGAAARAEQPLWEAELDQGIYERITPQTIVDSQSNVPKSPDEPSLR